MRRHLHGLALRTAAVALGALAAPFAMAQDATTTQAAAKPGLQLEMFFLTKSIFGFVIIWLLILGSVSVVSLIIHHALRNRRTKILPPAIVEQTRRLLEERRFRDAIDVVGADQSVFSQLTHAAFSESPGGYQAMLGALDESVDLHAARRIRSLELLNVLGAIGPMLGLLGTVFGMISIFQSVVDAGGRPNPSDLSVGISTKLVATFWGLIVGIPALAGCALIRNHIEGLMEEASLVVEDLIRPFRPNAVRAPGAPEVPGFPRPAAHP